MSTSIAPSNRPLGFKTVSDTGAIFAIYKNIGLCECKEDDPDILFNEGDPTHKACFGTGLKRNLYFTPLCRYTYSSVTKNSNLEQQSFERMKGNVITIYLPKTIELSYTDIICSLKFDSDNNPITPYQVEYVFKILTVDKHMEDDFKFYSIKATKLQHAPFEAIIK